MGEVNRGEHRPIQTSAVVLLNGSNRPATRPPSPPTPSTSPADSTAPCGALADLQLSSDYCDQYRPSKYHSNTYHGNSLRHGSSEVNPLKDRRLRDGIHIINTEALALDNLTQLYRTDDVARDGFHKAVEAIMRQSTVKSKLVIIGVGKSGLIGKKLVATFQSLAVRAVFLHPTEALHGDLGVVGPDDTLLFITYSGSTQELLAVLPHLDESLPVILMTSHTQPDTCEFINRRPGTILLPAPVHEPERVSFGVSAPTTSTTVALALGDALALTVAHELHPNMAQKFAKNHPGGAIGVAAAKATAVATETTIAARTDCSTRQLCSLSKPLVQISLAWERIHDASHLCGTSKAASLLRASYSCKDGWIRVGERIAAPSQLRSLDDDDLFKSLDELREGKDGLLVSCHDMLAMSAETTVRQARDMLRGTWGGGGRDGDGMRDASSCRGMAYEDEDLVATATWGSSVIAVTESGRICGVVEVSRVFADDEC